MTSRSSPSHASVASDEIGERILRAWHEETLLLPLGGKGRPRRLPGQPERSLLAGLGGGAHVELLGTGETFAAWHLRASDGAELLVRVPWHEPAHPLADELAALTQLPPGVGPEPVALREDSGSSPLDVPYLVTTPVPGRILPPSAWTRAHLLAHADSLARLHRVTAPGRGPVSLGVYPWERTSGARLSLLELFTAETQHVDSGVLDLIGGAGLLRAAEQALRSTDSAFADLEGFVLSHGDLCATNIVWEGTPRDPRPRYIDFEWAMADDPARDLAIIGGPVHGGPWYVPLTDEDIAALLDRYLHARTQLDEASDLPRFEGQAPLRPAPTLDAAGLRTRRDAWEIYEKTAMLLHVAGRAVGSAGGDSTGTDLYRAALPPLRSTLSALLGVE
jgi:aminoglycoside phosphotransferase (APT) family kinase protein